MNRKLIGKFPIFELGLYMFESYRFNILTIIIIDINYL